MISRNRMALLAATTILASGIATPASAQDSAADDVNSIVVTARRVEERLQNVPISIAVISQKDISDQNIVSSKDLATFTPSLSVNPIFGADNTNFAIRGFVQVPFSSPSVGTYFGDVIAPRGASTLSSGDGSGAGALFDLQNVQVLKGPQGTLQGRNTTGGAVLLVPQRPTGEFGGYVEGSLGNYDMRRLQAVVNVPLSETARLRLGVDRMKRDGYLHNISGVGPKDYDDVDYIAVRASMVVDLTPDLENYTIVSLSHSHNNGSISKIVACNLALPQVAPFCQAQVAKEAATGDRYAVSNAQSDSTSKVDMWQVINTTTWTASDNLTVKNIASYAELRNVLRENLFGTAYDISALYPPPFTVTAPVSITNLGTLKGVPSNAQSTFVDELRFQGHALDGKLDWQGGVYFELAAPLKHRIGVATSAGPFCTDLSTLQCRAAFGSAVNVSLLRTTYRDLAAYAQATYAITDQLKATAGFRYTDDITVTSGELINYLFGLTGLASAVCNTNPTGTVPNCTAKGRQHSSAPTWLLGLDYSPSADVLIYGKYARGYRQGSISLSFLPPNGAFGPEKIDSVELGAKTSWRGSFPGYLNVALHYNKLSNQQVLLGFSQRTTSGSARTSSAICSCAESRVYGAEVDGAITPFTGFRLSSSFAYLNTRILSVTGLLPLPAALPGEPPWERKNPTLEGYPLTLAPKYKVTGTAAYTLPLPEETVGRITASATIVYSSGFYNDIGAVFARTKALTLLNANLNWSDVAGMPLDLSLFATNVTKKYYFPYVSNLFDNAGMLPVKIGEPRMFGVRVKYRFGAEAD